LQLFAGQRNCASAAKVSRPIKHHGDKRRLQDESFLGD
jgi:hypothetical protein